MTERSSGARRETSDSASTMRFFDGMAWPIPIAFAGAIGAMRFEQGDVIYSDARAYDALEGKLPDGLTAIQVLLPPRSARGSVSDAESDRRAANWQSETTIALIDLTAGSSETRVVSQGKLAMTIFRGDESWLDPDRDEPALPRSARELHQRLEQALPSFDARQKAARGARFVFVVDLASDASRSKAAGVEEALRSGGSVERIDLSAEGAGIEDAAFYHPTAIVRGLVLAGRATDDVLPILRAQLYGGATRGASASEDGQTPETTDRFSIGRHGILDAIGSKPPATRSGSSPT
jgi:hypothetical protein